MLSLSRGGLYIELNLWFVQFYCHVMDIFISLTRYSYYVKTNESKLIPRYRDSLSDRVLKLYFPPLNLIETSVF